ncbi:hypothetical protein SBA7_30024 [Candidatus Sulfotelmatobacter sp. SbA7]|nr:hypothetical protein SBA7_30024 [Candidatus Sulfotelmatobacter sp. SbA7]
MRLNFLTPKTLDLLFYRPLACQIDPGD